MKMHRRWTAGLLLAGLLAAGNGAAGEDSTASAERTREHARAAVEAAARDAARAIRDSNQLDLDIRLIGPTSETIASDR
jgi:hypothetical protein